jgi:hypothetical protein
VRKKLLPAGVARSETAAKYFLECLRGTGDVSLSRRMTGITSDDIKILCAKYPEFQQKMDDAEMQGKETRLKQGLELIQKAHSLATVCEKPLEMLEVARVIAPEVAVYPVEKERARAKAEHLTSVNATSVNNALADLAIRLQQALKEP